MTLDMPERVLCVAASILLLCKGTDTKEEAKLT